MKSTVSSNFMIFTHLKVLAKMIATRAFYLSAFIIVHCGEQSALCCKAPTSYLLSPRRESTEKLLFLILTWVLVPTATENL